MNQSNTTERGTEREKNGLSSLIFTMLLPFSASIDFPLCVYVRKKAIEKQCTIQKNCEKSLEMIHEWKHMQQLIYCTMRSDQMSIFQ